MITCTLHHSARKAASEALVWFLLVCQQHHPHPFSSTLCLCNLCPVLPVRRVAFRFLSPTSLLSLSRSPTNDPLPVAGRAEPKGCGADAELVVFYRAAAHGRAGYLSWTWWLGCLLSWCGVATLDSTKQNCDNTSCLVFARRISCLVCSWKHSPILSSKYNEVVGWFDWRELLSDGCSAVQFPSKNAALPKK